MRKVRKPLTPKVGWRATVTVKLGRKDAHYKNGLVAGAKILELFGDAATLLCLRETGGKNEGLFRAYSSVDFLKPAYAGDVIAATAVMTRVGNTSRTLRFVAKKGNVVICRAIGTVVVRR